MPRTIICSMRGFFHCLMQYFIVSCYCLHCSSSDSPPSRTQRKDRRSLGILLSSKSFCGKCCVGLRNSNIKLRSKLTLVQPWPNVAPGATSGPQSYFCGPWPVTLGRVGLKKHSVLAYLMVVLENSIPYREMHCMAWVKWPSV